MNVLHCVCSDLMTSSVTVIAIQFDRPGSSSKRIVSLHSSFVDLLNVFALHWSDVDICTSQPTLWILLHNTTKPLDRSPRPTKILIFLSPHRYFPFFVCRAKKWSPWNPPPTQQISNLHPKVAHFRNIIILNLTYLERLLSYYLEQLGNFGLRPIEAYREKERKSNLRLFQGLDAWTTLSQMN